VTARPGPLDRLRHGRESAMRGSLLAALLALTLHDVTDKADMRMREEHPAIPCPSEWELIDAEYCGEACQVAGVRFTHTRATGDCVWVTATVKDEFIVNLHWQRYHMKPDSMPAEFDFGEMKGIYSLRRDRLRICLAAPGKPRPKDFRTVAGDKRLLFVLEREKP
jgi:uncharacterized protein (TIGR03067 family)